MVGDGVLLAADGDGDGVGDAAEVATAVGLLPAGVEGAVVPPDSAVQPASIRPAMINPLSPVRTVMT